MDRERMATHQFEHECRIRDYYVTHLSTLRPDERLIATEYKYEATSARADMRTVDKHEVLREWEFKIWADYGALGQILTYVALARRRTGFQRAVRGVIAAFGIRDEVKDAIEIMNLGLEVVIIPPWMAQAGGVPLSVVAEIPGIRIPLLSQGDIRASTDESGV